MSTSVATGPVHFDSLRRREAQRRFAVKWVFFIFILSLIEGPLRKWFLPGLAGPLTLLRDPFVIVLYGYCLNNGLMRLRGVAAPLWLGFATLTSLVGLVQYAEAGFSVWGWTLGVRTYWLYLPLAFVVAKAFTPEDILRFMRLCVWIAIPYAWLVVAQYNAPPFAFVNLGVAGDENASAGLTKNILRPFGLFSYTWPNVQFAAFVVAAFIAFYVANAPMRRRGLFLAAGGISIAVMSVLTGSRSIYFLVAMILLFTLFGLWLARPGMRAFSRSIGIAGFVLLAAALFVAVFPDMLEAMRIRFEVAEGSEGSIWTRAFGGLIEWTGAIYSAPLLGAGIGAGAPGVARFLGLPDLIYGEGDLLRNVNELGLFLGFPMLFLRFGAAIWIAWIAFLAARRRRIWALPLAGFAFPFILMGPITHSPLNAFLVWLAAGFVMAIYYTTNRRRA